MPGTNEGRVCERLDAELGAGSSAGLDADYSAYLDAELAPERAAQLEAHLAGCEACRDRVAGLGAVDAALSRLEPGPVPADLQARLFSRIADDPSARRSAGRSRARVAPSPRRRWLTGPYVLAGAAVAIAAVAALLWPAAPPLAPTPEFRERPIAVVPPAPRSPLGAGPDAGASPAGDASATEIAAQQPQAVPPGDSSGPAPDPAPLEDGLLVVDETPPVPPRADPIPVPRPALVPQTAPEPAVLAAVEEPPSAARLPERDGLSAEIELATAAAQAPPEIGLPDAASDEELAELALALELDTLEDFDVIANLDLLELLVALEEDSG